MKNTQTTTNVTTNTLVESLVFNNRFATAKLTAEQIGAEGFDAWKKIATNLHRAAYKVYSQCENSGMKVADTTVDKTEVYDAIRVILTAFGEIKGHKLYANEESAIAIIGYAGRRGNVDAPELQFCNSRISNTKREIATAEKINGFNPEAMEALKANLETLEEERKELLATADMRHKQPTMTSFNAFRLDLEHFFARVIVGQMAKTLEELDAEEAKRKEERKAKAKARKAKKAEEKKVEEIKAELTADEQA